METNLERIKETSKLLYDTVEVKDDFMGFVVHPFVENIFSFDPDNNQVLKLDTEKGKKRHREITFKIIDDSKDINHLFLFVRTAWKLTWLKFVKPYLSKKDFSNMLRECWIIEENPNMDLNVSRKESIKWFKEADKSELMEESDLEYFKNLPETLTVWRGVSPSREKLGLSWTDDKSKATWFQNRFNTDDNQGILLEATIEKKDVLAYLDTRDEKEIVVDVFKIKDKIIEI